MRRSSFSGFIVSHRHGFFLYKCSSLCPSLRKTLITAFTQICQNVSSSQTGTLFWLFSPVVPRGQSRKFYHPWTCPYHVLLKLSQSTNYNHKIKVVLKVCPANVHLLRSSSILYPFTLIQFLKNQHTHLVQELLLKMVFLLSQTNPLHFHKDLLFVTLTILLGFIVSQINMGS